PAEPGCGVLQEVLPELPGEALAGLAGGAGREGPAAEVGDVLTGGIAMGDLGQEQVDGGGRGEGSPAPARTDGLAGVGDGPGAEAGGEVVPAASEDGGEARWHGAGSIRFAVSCSTPSCRELSPDSTRQSGSPGWSPTPGPHRSGRAQFGHPALQAMS